MDDHHLNNIKKLGNEKKRKKRSKIVIFKAIGFSTLLSEYSHILKILYFPFWLVAKFG